MPQERRWRGHFGLRTTGLLAAVPLASRHRLEGCGGHVEQQLAQVGAAFGAAQVLVDGFAPATTQGGALELVHVQRALHAFGVRDLVQRGGHVLDHQPVVHRQADLQVVDGQVGREGGFIGHTKGEGLDVGQLGFDVPQTVFAVVATVGRGSRM